MIMTRYESLEHWLGTRAWGQSAARLKALSDRRDALFEETDLVALLALSRRQPLADAPEAEPGVYILETFRAKLDDMEHFRELTEDVWAPWAEAEGGVRLVGMWRSYIGPQERIHVLTRADRFAAWEARHAPTSACVRALEERAAMSARSCVQLLYPLTRRRP